MSEVVAGALRFDSVQQIESGWASIQGEEPFRFDHINDLESRCFFVSNIGFDEANKTGMVSNAKIRNTDYLNVNFSSVKEREPKQSPVIEGSISSLSRVPNDLIGQLGIGDNDWQEQVQAMASITDKVYRESKEAFDLDYPPFKKLASGIREKLMGYDTVIKDDKLFDALSGATVHYSLVQRSIDAIQPETDFGINVSLPKVEHAFNILSKPLPNFNTKWKMITKRVRADKSVEFVRSLESHGIYLLRVNIKSMSGEYGHIINFGTSKEQRTWITGSDAQFLAQFAEFEIYQGFEAESVIDGHEVYKAIQENYTPEHHDLSHSAGLFMQNVWTALSMPYRPPSNIIKTFEAYNPFTPFIKSYDRLALIEAAKKLDEKNIIVSSYAKSELKIVLKDTQITPDIFHDFKEANVIPFGLKMDMDAVEIDSSNSKDIQRKIYMEGNTDAILALDDNFYSRIGSE